MGARVKEPSISAEQEKKTSRRPGCLLSRALER